MLKIVKDGENLKKCEEGAELIDYVLSLIRSNALLQSSAMYEIGDSQGAASVFATSSARIEGVSHTYTSAGSSITFAMASLDHLGALYARNAVSADMVKEMYATGYIESRQ